MTTQERVFVDALVTLMLQHGVILREYESYSATEEYIGSDFVFEGTLTHLPMSKVVLEYERRTRRIPNLSCET